MTYSNSTYSGGDGPSLPILPVHHDRNNTPGWEGSVGPVPGQYGTPHVYARDVHSGAGNCMCGQDVGHAVHVQAAPGIPVPDEMRY